MRYAFATSVGVRFVAALKGRRGVRACSATSADGLSGDLVGHPMAGREGFEFCDASVGADVLADRPPPTDSSTARPRPSPARRAWGRRSGGSPERA